VNGPTAIDYGYQALPYPKGGPSITHNRTALSYPGKEIDLKWESPGQTVGPYENGTYTTVVGANVTLDAAAPKLWLGWIQQLNTT
jgi:hypothetical protein